jgi:hypothetical protein
MLGSVVAGVSDINGDGFPDVVMSAPTDSPDGMLGAGSVYHI